MTRKQPPLPRLKRPPPRKLPSPSPQLRRRRRRFKCPRHPEKSTALALTVLPARMLLREVAAVAEAVAVASVVAVAATAEAVELSEARDAQELRVKSAQEPRVVRAAAEEARDVQDPRVMSAQDLMAKSAQEPREVRAAAAEEADALPELRVKLPLLKVRLLRRSITLVTRARRDASLASPEKHTTLLTEETEPAEAEV